MQVLVRDNNVDQALRGLKKKMQREGLIAAPKRKARSLELSLTAPPWAEWISLKG